MTLVHRDHSAPTPLHRRILGWPEQVAHLMEEAEVPVEEYLDGEHLVVRAAAPGLDPERDVEITVSGRILRISVERRRRESSQDAEGFRSEFSYGHFVRTVDLPQGATGEDVTATYTDGVLEVRLPVVLDAVDPTRVPVTHG